MADKGFSAQDSARQLGHRDNGEIARKHYMKRDEDRQLSRIRRQWVERIDELRVGEATADAANTEHAANTEDAAHTEDAADDDLDEAAGW